MLNVTLPWVTQFNTRIYSLWSRRIDLFSIHFRINETRCNVMSSANQLSLKFIIYAGDTKKKINKISSPSHLPMQGDATLKVKQLHCHCATNCSIGVDDWFRAIKVVLMHCPTRCTFTFYWPNTEGSSIWMLTVEEVPSLFHIFHR